MQFRKLLAALGIALLLASAGCATKTVRDVAAEEGVQASPELLYFGALEDYKQSKKDALAYSRLLSTTRGEIGILLRVLNGGTSDRGCTPESIEARCLDGSDGFIRAFEQVRRVGGVNGDRYQAASFALAAAAAQLRVATGEGQ